MTSKIGTRRTSSDVIYEYVGLYAGEVVRVLGGDHCALLLGPLGVGKSAVLERVKTRLEGRGHTQCVMLDVATAGSGLAPRDLLARVAQALSPATAPADLDGPDAEGRLRAWLREWMRSNGKSVVLLIDHVEWLTRSREAFMLLRALYQQFLAERDRDEDAPVFLFVLASAQSLRQQLLSPVSPISNILREVAMGDCESEMRQAHWRALLRGLQPADQTSLVNALDALCAGDPYVIRNMTRALRAALDKLTPENTQDDAADAVRRLVDRAHNNPTNIAPLFERYGEMLDDDFAALELATSLAHDRAVTSAQQAPREDALTAALWTGLFRLRDGAWRFRSGLAGEYFNRAFLFRPARMVDVFRRNQRYESAIRFLDHHRDTEPERLNVLEDVTHTWVRDANTPSQAWQVVAKMLDLWFGRSAQLHRFHPREQSAARVPNAYYRVVPDGLEALASDAMQAALHSAFDDSSDVLAAQRADFVRGPIPIMAEDARWAFMLQRDGREYGAVTWTESVYGAESDNRRVLDFWMRFFNNLFREIVRFERDVLSDIDIARIQRIAQEHNQPEAADGVLRLILGAITERAGLRFDRAVLLQSSGGDALHGRVAVGQHALARAATGMSFGDLLRHSPVEIGRVPKDTLTPLDREAASCTMLNWREHAPLARALRGDTPELVTRQELQEAGGALSQLLRIDAGAEANAERALVVVPIRDGAVREVRAVLIVDQPFAHDRMTQEQLDTLPQFAAQIGLVLQNEEMNSRRALFDQFGMFGTQRWSLQQTLEAIAEASIRHLRGRVSQLMITIWETSGGDDPNRPNRRQSTLRVVHSAALGNRLKDFQYRYYAGDRTDAQSGCVDRALFEDPHMLYVPDLPRWHAEHGASEPAALFDGMRSVYSCALKDDDSSFIRGVMSFQSEFADAFGDGERAHLRQIVLRTNNVVEKALSYEGLSRARRNTRQLNRAMSELIKQQTNSALYTCILNRALDLFTGDLRTLDSQRKADSAVLLAMDGNDIAGKLEGKKTSTMAEQLAQSCNAMRRAAMRGTPAFVEHAAHETVAREQFGQKDCDMHKACGAEASVWARVGAAGDMLLVLAWKKPRRMNHTERTALPLLTEIAARTNGVIEQERALMRQQLESSLSVDDYAMIEAEYTHQWNKRIRTMRRNAQYARELLGAATSGLDVAQMEKLRGFLQKIERTGEEAIDRMGAVEYLRRSEQVPVKRWLQDYVERWNLLYAPENDALKCEFHSALDDSHSVTTRPIILTWILHELLQNARDAEMSLPPDGRRLAIEAGYDRIQRAYEISVTNNKTLPREELDAIRNRSPIGRTNKSGRGIWIAGGQVQSLLGGTLILPGPEDTTTKFTLFLPEAAVNA